MMNQSTSKMEDIEKHYRVTLDFRVLIREITEDVCRESFFCYEESATADDPDFQELVERQRRLYSLLRNNEKVLKQYLLSVLTHEVENLVFDSLPDAFN